MLTTRKKPMLNNEQSTSNKSLTGSENTYISDPVMYEVLLDYNNENFIVLGKKISGIEFFKYINTKKPNPINLDNIFKEYTKQNVPLSNNLKVLTDFYNDVEKYDNKEYVLMLLSHDILKLSSDAKQSANIVNKMNAFMLTYMNKYIVEIADLKTEINKLNSVKENYNTKLTKIHDELVKANSDINSHSSVMVGSSKIISEAKKDSETKKDIYSGTKPMSSEKQGLSSIMNLLKTPASNKFVDNIICEGSELIQNASDKSSITNIISANV